MYASLFGISGALHLVAFEQPAKQVLISNLVAFWLLKDGCSGLVVLPFCSIVLWKEWATAHGTRCTENGEQ
jgi:hypothetical protein